MLCFGIIQGRRFPPPPCPPPLDGEGEGGIEEEVLKMGKWALPKYFANRQIIGYHEEESLGVRFTGQELA